MEATLTRHSATKGYIDRFWDNLVKVGKDKITQAYLKTRLALLESYWQRYQEIHYDIIGSEGAEVEAYKDSDDYTTTEDSYVLFKARIFSAMKEESPRPKQEISAPAVSFAKQIHLPKISLPTFSGDLLAWESFRDLFQSLVGGVPDLAPVQKLQYLKSSLSGEAAAAVLNVEMTDRGFDLAWTELKERYDNRRVLLATHMRNFLNEPSSAKPSSADLKRLSSFVLQARRSFESLERPIAHWDDWFVHVVVEKMDPSSRLFWEASLQTTTDFPTLAQLQDFLQTRIRALEAASVKTVSPAVAPGRIEKKKVNALTASTTGKSASRCGLCQGNHLFNYCSRFKALSVSQRRDHVKKQGACFNCLRLKHAVTDCPSSFRCSRCGEKHHALLHPPEADSASGQDSAAKGKDPGPTLSATTEPAVTTNVAALTSSSGTRILLSTARLVGGLFCDRAGRTASRPEPEAPRKVQPHAWPHLVGLTLADPEYDQPAPVDAILGADIFSALLREGLKRGPEGSPSAQATALGWVLMGRVSAPAATQDRSGVSVLHLSASGTEVDHALQRFWQLEELPTEPAASPEDLCCESQFAATHSRDSRGRYTVRLPRRDGSDVRLNDNRRDALSLLTSLERRLSRNPTLREQYATFMDEYQKLGHMVVVPATEVHQPGTHYLPHHVVFKKSDANSKIRVVFNASHRTSSGYALNDLLLPGPKLQSELWAILSRWRLFRHVFTADIDFRLLTVVYGTAAAPYLALRTLLQLAEDEGPYYPRGADAIRSHSYVDDILAGGHTLAEAVESKRQTEAILAAGGFELSKWASNAPELGPVADNDKLFCDREGVCTLGVLWSPREDSFALRLAPVSTARTCTKRTVPSEVARFFDLLGWAAPVLVYGKILMQDLWMAGLPWDEPLPENLRTTWTTFA
ncbi:PREDICTED: uncharacterized protein LOC105571049 [Vollenhovia emeryi]|uniref:uncharacterized protein LOC105571049 n=1 Tax=Vollenhovia emeryi TaxID=411798 RepID=UPI0005F51D70|nr:PREDICTED: uncharacterized protein LOC105571049 [Vollenhovia emeryi]